MKANRPPCSCICLALILIFVGSSSPVQAGRDLITGCGDDSWSGRLGMVFGPRYYTQQDDVLQFSLGLDGLLKLVGPLAFGVQARAGLLDPKDLSVDGGLRLNLMRNCKLELAALGRAGVWVDLGDDKGLVRGEFDLSLELVHDLGDHFYILFRGGGGMVFKGDRGGFVGMTLGLGLTFW